MFRYTLSSGLPRGGGISSGWPLKRGSTVVTCICCYKKQSQASRLYKLWLMPPDASHAWASACFTSATL